MSSRSGIQATLSVILLTAPAAHADPSLRAEGIASATSVWLGLRYDRTIDAPPGRGIHENAFALDLRSRLWLGRTLAYAPALEGAIGATETGAFYEVDLHAAGVGVRWDVGAAGVSSGFGLSGVGGSVPFALLAPVQAHLETSAGPLRVLVTATMRFALASEARRPGSPSVSFADEIAVALFVRLGGERRYWGTTVAGAGPAVGLLYHERMGSRFVGFVLALGLSGGK